MMDVAARIRGCGGRRREREGCFGIRSGLSLDRLLDRTDGRPLGLRESSLTDVFSKEKRSWLMSRVQGSNTKPEKLVRSLLHRDGFRFRLHGKGLPGKPDAWLEARLAPILRQPRPPPHLRSSFVTTP